MENSASFDANHRSFKSIITALLIILQSFFLGQLLAQPNPDSLQFYKETYKQNKSNLAYKKAMVAAESLYKLYYLYARDSSMIWIKKAHEMSLNTEDKQHQITTLLQYGAQQFANRQPEEAVFTYLKVDSLLELYPNPKIHANLLFFLAEGYEYTGRPELGMRTYNKCYEKAEAIDHQNLLAKLDLKMGNLHQVDGEYEKALTFYQKVIERGDKNNPKIMRNYYYGLLDYLDIVVTHPELFSEQELKQHGTTINQLYEEADTNAFLSRYKRDIFNQKIRFLFIHDEQNELQTIYLHSPDSLKKMSYDIKTYHSELGLYCEIARKQQNLPQAYQYIEAGDAIIDDLNNEVVKLAHLAQKKAVLVKMKRYKEAIEIADLHRKFEKKINNEKRLSSLDNLEGQIAAKEKEAELLVANQEKELLANRNKYLTIGGSLLTLLLGIIVWLFAQSRQKNKIISSQNAQLENLNVTKDRIFAVLGHDLRKPAISFRGITEKLRYLIEQKDFKTMEQLGGVLEKNAFALNKLTDNLLNWALTQKQALTYQPKPIRVAEMTEEVLDLFQSVAADKNITLTADIPKDLTLFADANSFLIIIRNLIDNAIKFTPKGGKVELISNITDKGVAIQIKDTGIGIPPDKMKDIFMLQNNKSERGTAGEKGTGLGLHLVNELVKINKGLIEVLSPPKQGTTFNLLFPKVT